MIDIIKNGKVYSNFTSKSLRQSLDSFCSEFSLSTEAVGTPGIVFGDEIKVNINGDTHLTGTIEKENISKSDGKMINLSGRSYIGDLIDSSVPNTMKFNRKIGFTELIEQTLKPFGLPINVINQAGSLAGFSNEEITAVGFGGKVMDFLASFARKRNVFLNDVYVDNNINIVIFSPPTVSEYEKLNASQMRNQQTSKDSSSRFNKIIIGSQDNASAINIPGYSTGSNQIQTAEDPDIRASRILEVEAEESMKSSELKKRAAEEINIRRARSFTYSFTVDSHNYKVGRLISLQDDELGVKGIFLIKEITYIESTTGGEESNITVCYPEAYTGIEKRTTERKSKIGD